MDVLIDANVILSLMIGEDDYITDIAADIVSRCVTVLPEVLAEVVYVLESVYEVSRDEIVEALKAFLGGIGEYHGVMGMAVNIYSTRKLDFVDCILGARNRIEGRAVFSFDKMLNAELARIS